MMPSTVMLRDQARLSAADLVAQLQREADVLQRRTMATLAHEGHGRGARRYSRKALGEHAQRVLGMYEFARALIASKASGADISESERVQVHTIIVRALGTAEGKIK